MGIHIATYNYGESETNIALPIIVSLYIDLFKYKRGRGLNPALALLNTTPIFFNVLGLADTNHVLKLVVAYHNHILLGHTALNLLFA